MYGYSARWRCMLFIGASSAFGDIERLRWPGEGVDIGEPAAEYCSPSDLGPRPVLLLPCLVARAAAVAAAASSTVPVWWF
jgi:hypothetical protein